MKIARSLSKTTVAECVEDAATLDIVRRLGVDLVQGYHLGRPTESLTGERGYGQLRVASEQRGRGS